MGIRISMENKIDDIERRLKLVEGALEELVQTRMKHVDLTEIDTVKPKEIVVTKSRKKTKKAEATT
tara:strand:+ start:1545 stop:1742 length:198 start_codon:yes stop_codon:yes gene_type:complete